MYACVYLYIDVKKDAWKDSQEDMGRREIVVLGRSREERKGF